MGTVQGKEDEAKGGTLEYKKYLGQSRLDFGQLPPLGPIQ